MAIVAMTVATTGAAFAHQGDPDVEGPSHSPERHAEMTQAFESKDYETWAKLMEDKGRVTQIINADNFEQLAEAHMLAKEGKFEEAKAIRAELGLGLKDGSGQGSKRGQGQHQGQGQRNGLKNETEKCPSQ